MATLILTTVGGAIGGPIGAALGGLLGSAFDNRVLFKPKGRQGPRLTELPVQTSSYGCPIPRLFGTMRVAGSVIWAIDLQENRTRMGGGKGRPTTTTYSYSASFAVLLSARAVVGVGRIWADGKLLRGSAGDFKTVTGFRLHNGGEAQVPDPLIAAAEGAGLAPAHRGQAYAVFEDFQLGDYGNRIPSLTFEVIADTGPVSVGSIADELGVAADGAGTTLGGFSVYGDSVRGVLETLASVDGGWFAAEGSGIRLRAGSGPAAALADAGVARDRGGARGVRALAAADDAPKRVRVAHYDPARDYQTGLQSAQRPGAGTREERVELPAALASAAAKAVAEGVLARAEAGRERRTITLAAGGASAALNVAPGDRVTITDENGTGEPGLWRVARWRLAEMVVTLELVRIARASAAAGAGAGSASSGRVSGAPDLVHGATTLHAFELPPVDDAVLSAPRLTIAAAGGPGWRQAALLLSSDGGARWTAAGTAQVPVTIGTIAVAPGAGSALLVDRAGSMEVELLHPGMTLSDADAVALDAGANLALVGDELVQFGRAAPLSPTRWRLSELWRGRRGTEAAAGTQAPGDRFVLIEAAALITVELPLAVLGGSVEVLASGVGDGDGPAVADAVFAGASVRPPAPVALRWKDDGAGGATLRWTRRSRAGWRWLDGGDVPLGEESELYRVTIGARVATVAVAEAGITAAERAGGPVSVSVSQLGTFGESPPATLVV
ncbi:MAG: phage tail protein [Pseudomonadota bacterium]